MPGLLEVTVSDDGKGVNGDNAFILFLILHLLYFFLCISAAVDRWHEKRHGKKKTVAPERSKNNEQKKKKTTMTTNKNETNSSVTITVMMLASLLLPTTIAEHVETTTTLLTNSDFTSWNVGTMLDWSSSGTITSTSETKDGHSAALKVSGTGILCQVITSLVGLETYELHMENWVDTINVNSNGAVEVFDGISCTDPSKQIVLLKPTIAKAWSKNTHRFQAAVGSTSVAVALRVASSGVAWFKSVNVYRVLCTPSSTFFQSRVSLDYGSQINAAVSGSKIYVHTHQEQVFGKVSYSGDLDDWKSRGGDTSTSINPPPAYSYNDNRWKNECSGPNAHNTNCWPVNKNRNVRIFDTEINSWDRNGVKVPAGFGSRANQGAMTSCGGVVVAIGEGYNSPVWTFSPATNIWENTIHKAFPTGFHNGKLECIKSTLFVIGSQVQYSGNNQFHIAKYDMTTKIWDLNFSDETQWLPCSSADL